MSRKQNLLAKFFPFLRIFAYILPTESPTSDKFHQYFTLHYFAFFFVHFLSFFVAFHSFSLKYFTLYPDSWRGPRSYLRYYVTQSAYNIIPSVIQFMCGVGRTSHLRVADSPADRLADRPLLPMFGQAPGRSRSRPTSGSNTS